MKKLVLVMTLAAAILGGVAFSTKAHADFPGKYPALNIHNETNYVIEDMHSSTDSLTTFTASDVIFPEENWFTSLSGVDFGGWSYSKSSLRGNKQEVIYTATYEIDATHSKGVVAPLFASPCTSENTMFTSYVTNKFNWGYASQFYFKIDGKFFAFDNTYILEYGNGNTYAWSLSQYGGSAANNKLTLHGYSGTLAQSITGRTYVKKDAHPQHADVLVRMTGYHSISFETIDVA